MASLSSPPFPPGLALFRTSLCAASMLFSGFCLGGPLKFTSTDPADGPQPSNTLQESTAWLDSSSPPPSSPAPKAIALASAARPKFSLDFIPADERERRTRNGYPCVTSPEGSYSIEGHGSPANIFDRTGEPMTAPEVAKFIRKDSHYHAGMTVYLLCCETGKGGRPFAQKLADSLGVEVIAPTEKLWPKRNGGYSVAQELVHKTLGIFEVGEQRADTSKPGAMKTFRPSQGAVAANSSHDEASQIPSSSSAASPTRMQQAPKKPLLRAGARTAALLAGMPEQRDSAEFLNSKAR